MRTPNALILFDTSLQGAGWRDALDALGADAAADLRAAFTVDAAQRFGALPFAHTRIALADVMLHSRVAAAAPTADVMMQSGETPAARLIDAFEDAFDAGFKHVMLLFSDALTVPHRAMETGFVLLDTFDDALVLGPTDRQGVYAVGMRHPNDAVLSACASAGEASFLAALGALEPDEAAVYALVTWASLADKDALIRFSAEGAAQDDGAPFAAIRACVARNPGLGRTDLVA